MPRSVGGPASARGDLCRRAITHGANDRQIPLEYATEHIGPDHLPYVHSYIADRVADTFAELAAVRR